MAASRSRSASLSSSATGTAAQPPRIAAAIAPTSIRTMAPLPRSLSQRHSRLSRPSPCPLPREGELLSERVGLAQHIPFAEHVAFAEDIAFAEDVALGEHESLGEHVALAEHVAFAQHEALSHRRTARGGAAPPGDGHEELALQGATGVAIQPDDAVRHE